MRKTAIAIRHLAFEDLGVFAPELAAAGYEIRYLEAGRDDLRTPELATCDLLVVLGGPIGADQDDLYPFLRDELQTLETRLSAQRPTLGVCLGAQLMARALGSRIYPAPAKEIGFAPLTPTAAGTRSPLSALAAAEWQVLHWHGDTFDLPTDATHLAATDICANQAFALGDHALGLQFHMETPPHALEHWLIGHCFELMAGKIDIPALRASAHRLGTQVSTAGAHALRLWLQQLPAAAGP